MNEAVNEALRRCFEKARVVFWYDEGGKCREEFDAVALDGVEKLVVASNEFGIKYKILSERPEGRFLVYSPKAQPAPADDWLYDLYLAGASFSTDPVSMVMSEMSFPEEARGVLAEKTLPFFRSSPRKREVKALLATLERRPTAEEVELALMCAVCRVRDHLGIERVLVVLLKELSENRTDRIDELAKYGLEPALWRRLGVDYGYRNATGPSVVDFANRLFHDAFYPAIRDEGYQLSHAALSFFNDWKNGVRTREAFKALSADVARKLDVASVVETLPPDAFGSLDVFREIDEHIVKALVAEAERGSLRGDDAARLVGQRKDGCFWADFADAYQACEAAVRFFADLATLDLSSADAADAIAKYAGSWHRIDRNYRLFVEHYNRARKTHDAAVDLFAALKGKVDGHYVNNYLARQSVGFQQHLNKLREWKFAGLELQTDFWKNHVRSAGVSVCVIVSDALRYEIGRELAESVEATHRYSATIEPMVGVVPSYTQLGMAALLPHEKLEFAYQDGALKPVTDRVLADGRPTAGLEARKAILESVAEPKATAIAYKDVMAMTKAECRRWQSSASVLYVYHDVIDKRGDRRESEDETAEAAREAIADVTKLIAKVGGDYRIGKFIVTADHGFLYQDCAPEPSQFVEDVRAEAQACVSKTRFMLGEGMDDSDCLMNFDGARLGHDPDVQVKLAKGITRMRRPGSGVKFVHGGASLQEIVVPVVEIRHVRSNKEDVVPVEAEILIDGAGRITTNRFGVSVYQSAPVGEAFSKRIVRLSLRTPRGELLSDEVQLVLDSEAEAVPDRTKSAMLTLNHAANAMGSGSVVLEMETGRERAGGRIDFDVYKKKPMTLRLAVANFFD